MHLRVRLVLPVFLALATLVLAPTTTWGSDSVLTLTLEAPSPLLGPVALTYDGGDLALDEAYLTDELLGYQWRLGIQPIAWGPSPDENLLYSGRPGLPMVWVSRDYRGFEILPAMHYENFYAALPPRDGSNRYLIGRRYSVVNEHWQAGLIETALLSGDFSPYYLIPYPFFPISVGKVFLTESGVGDPRDANMLYGVDLKHTGAYGYSYVSLMIDEAPLTPQWEGPWRVGLQAGAETSLGRDVRLWAEYTAISRYAYTYLDGYARGDYCAGDELLGHSLGPDADLLRIRLTKEFAAWQGWLELARERHGEGRFGDRWDPASGQVFEFLTGTIETSYWLKGGFALRLVDNLTSRIELGVAQVENAANQAGVAGWDSSLTVQVNWTF